MRSNIIRMVDRPERIITKQLNDKPRVICNNARKIKIYFHSYVQIEGESIKKVELH